MWKELTSRLDAASLDRLDQVLIRRHIAANAVLFWEGQTGSTMSVIDGGPLLVERTTENGDTAAGTTRTTTNTVLRDLQPQNILELKRSRITLLEPNDL